MKKSWRRKSILACNVFHVLDLDVHAKLIMLSKFDISKICKYCKHCFSTPTLKEKKSMFGNTFDYYQKNVCVCVTERKFLRLENK